MAKRQVLFSILQKGFFSTNVSAHLKDLCNLHESFSAAVE